MKKTLVSVLWIALLNAAFGAVFVEFSVRFNPTITHQEASDFGGTYGFGFFVISIALIVYLAVTDRLPGARSCAQNEEVQ